MGRAILIIGAGALLVGIWVYGLVDAARTDKLLVRTLPKWAWVLITFLVPIIGCILWLLLGRPKKSGTASSGFGGLGRKQGGSMKAPDDDEDYLRFLEQQERRRKRDRKDDENAQE